jgi:hypothetical protein
MAHDPEATPTPNLVYNLVGELVGSCPSADWSDDQGGVDEGSEGHSGDGGPAGSVPREPDGSEVDEIAQSDEEGQREGTEPHLSESETLSAAARAFTQANGIGSVLDPASFQDFAFDGKNFYDKAEDGWWRPLASSMVHVELKGRGLSAKAAKGQVASQIDIALRTILKSRRVDGAAPFLYHKEDIVDKSGRKFLNMSMVKAMLPAESAGAWGEKFPIIAQVYDNVFASDLYRNLFLAWFKRFYSTALAGDPALGQILALVGPVHCYKSWTIHKVLKPAMGGFADMSNMAAGQSGGFNAEVFRAPLAVIDDSQGASSEDKRLAYASALKKLVAHGSHMYHEKYLTPTEVEWKGRVVLALNDDPVSIRLMPTMELSNADKIVGVYLKTWADHPPSDVFDNLENTELPHFLAWLLNWEPPEDVVDRRGRYGIRAIVADEIKEKQFQSSTTGATHEKLNEWWARRTADDRAKPFIGTASALLDELGACFRNSPEQLRGLTQIILSSKLRELAAKGDMGVEVVPKSPLSKKSLKFKIFMPWVDAPEPVVFAPMKE